MSMTCLYFSGFVTTFYVSIDMIYKVSTLQHALSTNENDTP